MKVPTYNMNSITFLHFFSLRSYTVVFFFSGEADFLEEAVAGRGHKNHPKILFFLKKQPSTLDFTKSEAMSRFLKGYREK